VDKEVETWRIKSNIWRRAIY